MIRNKMGTSQFGDTAIYLKLKKRKFLNYAEDSIHEKRTKNFRNTFEKPKRPNWRAGCPLTQAPGALKRGSIWDFLAFLFLQNIIKMKGRDIEMFFFEKKRKTRILNSFIVNKNIERATHCDFYRPFCCKRSGPFGAIYIFEKKSSCRKNRSCKHQNSQRGILSMFPRFFTSVLFCTRF